MAYWYKNRLNVKADAGTSSKVVDSITSIINKNTKSYHERAKNFEKIQSILIKKDK